jgi:hypothetical protein
VVWFFPVDAAESSPMNPAKDRRSSGIVQHDGSFQMSTYGKSDGAPQGRYRIGVTWSKRATGADDEESLLPLEFVDPDRAGLPTVEVKPEPNELPPFNLCK